MTLIGSERKLRMHIPFLITSFLELWGVAFAYLVAIKSYQHSFIIGQSMDMFIKFSMAIGKNTQKYRFYNVSLRNQQVWWKRSWHVQNKDIKPCCQFLYCSFTC